MQTVRTSQGGIDYLMGVLRETQRTITRVTLWRIPHQHQDREDIRLKLGRYHQRTRLVGPSGGQPVELTPKSELTLDESEFKNLVQFLSENYEPFRSGERRYIPITGQLHASDIAQLRQLFEDPDTKRVVDFVLEHQLLPEDVLAALQFRARQRAVDELKRMLDDDLVEHKWQKWFETNDWIFGSDFVRIIDERSIDTDNVADYLMEAYDGFLDIIEIKRPEGGLRFWAEARDHGNLVPATELVKAITQTTNYLYEVEREANSVKFLNRIGVRTVKPRATLVFGRSVQWGDDEREAYRVLNRSYHDITILTYDHVLDRANRILESKNPQTTGVHPRATSEADGDIPF